MTGTPLPGEPAILTYPQVQARALELLSGHEVGTDGSARAMAVLVGEIIGREIMAPGHPHRHTISELGVTARNGTLELDLRVSPCPEAITVQILAPCPECHAGKHDNCDGRTWDHAADDVAPCPCAKGGHHPARSSG